MSQSIDVKPTPYVSQISCDRCGATADHAEHEFNHFHSIGIDATWGSPFGDGNRAEIDLCHSCLKELLGPWLRMSVQGWARQIERFGPSDEPGGEAV